MLLARGPVSSASHALMFACCEKRAASPCSQGERAVLCCSARRAFVVAVAVAVAVVVAMVVAMVVIVVVDMR